MKRRWVLIGFFFLLSAVIPLHAAAPADDGVKIEVAPPGDSATKVPATPDSPAAGHLGWDDPFQTDPFALMRQFHDDMDRFFEDSFGGGRFSLFPRGFSRMPTARSLNLGQAGGDFRVNMKEEGEQIVVICELPGMDKKQLKVRIHDNRLWISGTRKEETQTQGDNYYRREIRSGSVSRVLALPVAVDETSARARYQDGVLTVRLNRKGKLPEPGQEIPVE